MRRLYVAAGIALVVLGVVLAPLPGPGGLPVALVGTVVVLRNSAPMRRRWVTAKRRWPRLFGPIDSLLRKLRRRSGRSTRPV